jgi:hypothetical protein
VSAGGAEHPVLSVVNEKHEPITAEYNFPGRYSVFLPVAGRGLVVAQVGHRKLRREIEAVAGKKTIVDFVFHASALGRT